MFVEKNPIKLVRRAAHAVYLFCSEEVDIARRVATGRANSEQLDKFRVGEIDRENMTILAYSLGTGDIDHPEVLKAVDRARHLRDWQGEPLETILQARAARRLIALTQPPA